MGLSLALILQSKPPYILLIAGPVAVVLFVSLRKLGVRPTVQFVIGALPLTLFAASWFVIKGPTYIEAALANQIESPLQSRDVGIFSWILSFFRNYVAVALFGALAIVRLFWKRFAGLSELELVSLIFSATAPLVMLTVDLRPRYIIIPMLGMTTLAAIYANDLLNNLKVSSKILVYGTGLAGLVQILLFTLFSVSVHRNEKLVAGLRAAGEPAPTDVVLCLEDNNEEKTAPKARMASLLFDLEFNKEYSVQECGKVAELALQGALAGKSVIVSSKGFTRDKIAGALQASHNQLNQANKAQALILIPR